MKFSGVPKLWRMPGVASAKAPAAPLLLGYVLGPLLEEHLRRAMLLARGDPMSFFTRPISLTFMIGTALVFAAVLAPAIKKAARGPGAGA